jgi:hypothetical protein
VLSEVGGVGFRTPCFDNGPATVLPDLGVVNCGTKKLKAVLGKTFIFLTKLAQITRESSILLVPLVNKARITVNHFKSPAPGVNTMM